jgi:hypothetical protein
MKPSSIKKVFGIISYLPDSDTDFHIETRRERSRRFHELLFKLEELWPNVDIMIIAQNWQEFELPKIKNKIKSYYYGRLGILGARKELRKRFLESKYDYLIMLDDDARIATDNPKGYMDEIDAHPDGMGVLRKNKAPLNLCAVSRYVYSQIDMPDLDPEKSEGFEDDLFVATCFAKLPDNSFMFPEGLVSETSLNYKGPGACPSTWAKERTYNWDYMRKLTDARMKELENPKTQETEPVNADIDLIVSYVNSSDNNWLRDYGTATKTHNPSQVRFRSWGTLKYLLRGVDKYMPFVRKVVLVVSRESQVPVWINPENVRVVYHKDFIPSQFLPTFNSCTIESFFWNIPDLADRVIYLNDDMFPTAPMTEENFFTGIIPHIKFKPRESYSAQNVFVAQCRSGMDMIMRVLNLPEYETGKVLLPYHISMAIHKNCFDSIRELCSERINETVSMIRQKKNVNQYIYAYYPYFTGAYIDDTVEYRYFDIFDSNTDDILTEILTENHQMLCLNDSDKIKDFARTRYRLTSCFEKKFPNKCRYESM